MYSESNTRGGTEYSEQSDDKPVYIAPIEIQRIPEVASKKLQSIQIPDKFKLVQTVLLESTIQSLDYLTDQSYVAIGCSDGSARIMSATKGDIQYVLKAADLSPVTGLAANKGPTMRNGLMVTHSEGTLQYWHATSKQLLFSKKYQEMLQACEINPAGTNYAFSGDEGKIRLGNLSKGEPKEVETGHIGSHQNRVFCLKWNPFDQNVFLSGGWDKAVHFWDVRTRTSVHKLYGCYIGGEAIDFRVNQILLGNNTNQHQLRIYDCKAGKMRSLQWPITSLSQTRLITGALGCCFGPEQRDDIFAITAERELRLFRNRACVSEFRHENEENKVYCLARARDTGRVITGWKNGEINIFEC